MTICVGQGGKNPLCTDRKAVAVSKIHVWQTGQTKLFVVEGIFCWDFFFCDFQMFIYVNCEELWEAVVSPLKYMFTQTLRNFERLWQGSCVRSFRKPQSIILCYESNNWLNMKWLSKSTFCFWVLVHKFKLGLLLLSLFGLTCCFSSLFWPLIKQIGDVGFTLKL